MTNKAYRFVLAVIGFTSTVAQLVLMRELVATFYGNELLFGLALMAWLAWVAVGAWALPRIVQDLTGLRADLSGLLVFAAIALPAQMALVRGARLVLGVTPGALVELGPTMGVVVLSLAPLCLLLGFLFTISAQASIEQGGTAGQAYALESAGAVAGGTLFSFLFIRYLDPFQIALLASALNLATAWYLISHRILLNFSVTNDTNPFGRVSRMFLDIFKPSRVSWLVPCALILAALGLGPVFHNATLRWQWPRLVFAADSPYGRLTIQANDGQRAWFQNGRLAFETQGTFSEEATHLPLLMHPDPRRVLLVGGGVGGDLREILKHPAASVSYVELDPRLIDAARAYLPAEDSAVLGDPRVRLALTDGRQFVRQCAADEGCAFDVVILDLPEPSTGALNRFYTRQFFEQVRAVLNPGGILAFGLPSAENYWSEALARRNGSIYQTLRMVFPEALAISGEHIFFVASSVPLESDPAEFARRLSKLRIQTRLLTPAYIEYLFTTDRFARAQQELEAEREGQLNEDLVPICYYYNLALWLSRFYPDLGRLFNNARAVRWWWMLGPLALIVAAARWRRQWAVPLIVACTGLSQMMLEVVLIFGFQVLHGSVYAEVSLIVTAFMAGLTLGAATGGQLAKLKALNWTLARRASIARLVRHCVAEACRALSATVWRRRAGRASRWTRRAPARSAGELEAGHLRCPKGTAQVSSKLALVIVQVAIAILGGVVWLILAWPIQFPGVFPLLAGLAGGLTGMAFPLAVALVDRHTPGQTVGRLYAADLVGGCLGALLTATFFVPVLGIPQTCAVIALVGLAGVLILMS
jgi:spermidine synthase